MQQEALDTFRRAEEAQRILDSEVFQAAYLEQEAQLIEAWRTSDLNAREDREIAYLALRALDGVKARLHADMVSAEIERDRIQKADRRRSAA